MTNGWLNGWRGEGFPSPKRSAADRRADYGGVIRRAVDLGDVLLAADHRSWAAVLLPAVFRAGCDDWLWQGSRRCTAADPRDGAVSAAKGRSLFMRCHSRQRSAWHRRALPGRNLALPDAHRRTHVADCRRVVERARTVVWNPFRRHDCRSL